MTDNNNNGRQTIPVELLLSRIGEEVQVNIDDRRRWLQKEIELRRQRLRELKSRQQELDDRMAMTAAPSRQPASETLQPDNLFNEAEELGQSSPYSGLDDLFPNLFDLDDDEMGSAPSQQPALEEPLSLPEDNLTMPVLDEWDDEIGPIGSIGESEPAVEGNDKLPKETDVREVSVESSWADDALPVKKDNTFSEQEIDIGMDGILDEISKIDPDLTEGLS